MVSDRFLKVQSTLEYHGATKEKGLRKVKTGRERSSTKQAGEKDTADQILQSKND